MGSSVRHREAAVALLFKERYIGQKMGGGYNWTWPQIPSLTAMKYQRHGYVEARPFLPGERLSGRKGCERNVKGYHELRQSLDRERKIMAAAMAPPEPKDRRGAKNWILQKSCWRQNFSFERGSLPQLHCQPYWILFLCLTFVDIYH